MSNQEERELITVDNRECDRLMEKIERLRKQLKKKDEQIKDAEYVLDEMGWADRGLIDEYFEKWGMK